MVTAINNTLSGKDTFLTTLQNNITTILSQENGKTLTDIDKRLEELQIDLLKLASSKADYEDVADEIYLLQEQKQKAQVENAGRDEQRKRIADMSEFLLEQPTVITEYNEQLVRLFSSDQNLLDAGKMPIIIYFMGFFMMALQFSGQSTFVALGKARQAIFFSLFRKIIIVVPLTILLPRVGALGVMGVFLAEPISNFIGGVASFTTMYATVYRKL